MHIFEIGHKYDQLPFIVLKYNSVSTWLSVEKPINIYKHICRTWCLQHTNLVCICREWRHEYIAKSIENSYCLIYSLFLVHNATNTHTHPHTHTMCVCDTYAHFRFSLFNSNTGLFRLPGPLEAGSVVEQVQSKRCHPLGSKSYWAVGVGQ